MLDKTDPPTVPDGYGLSVGFYCLVEAVRTIQLLVEGEQDGKSKETKGKIESKKKEPSEAGGDKSDEKGERVKVDSRCFIAVQSSPCLIFN